MQKLTSTIVGISPHLSDFPMTQGDKMSEAVENLQAAMTAGGGGTAKGGRVPLPCRDAA